MKISFIIITNASKPKKIIDQIESIYEQKIKEFEIIISGDKKNLNLPKENIKFISAKKEAKVGALGAMRNKACDVARYDNVVISDDDMLFCKDWYKNISYQKADFDILTPEVKLPDGTRFWDHCCYQSPVNGHSILEEDETDEHLYMSGGQSWVMKKHVWNKVKWDESIEIYKMKNIKDYKQGKHNEDTDFALRCRNAGFKITHNRNIQVVHNDASYTSVGRLVRRRIHKSQNWCKELNFPHKINLEIAKLLLSYGVEAEAVDLLRKCSLEGDMSADLALEDLENSRGGRLKNTNFQFHEK
jgi:glycosyltransferase involved in cell wall biosynthesis